MESIRVQARVLPLVLAITLGPSSCSCSKELVATEPVATEPVATTRTSTPVRTFAKTYAGELDRLDAAVEELQRLAAGPQQKSWMTRARLAGVYAERARLSGDWQDYQRADASLAEAFQMAGEGAGPFLARARLRYSLHRLNDAERDLAAFEKTLLLSDAERTSIAKLRAQIAFERGDYDAARRGLEAVDEADPTPETKAARGLYAWKTGDFASAEALYEDARARDHGNSAWARAWYPLQLGLMDLERGRYDDALAHYQDAEKALPGWWLVEEHMAELHALSGRHEAARAIYIDVVARTGNPELMDALADVEHALGNEKATTQWRVRAKAAHEARLALHPAAATGHTLEHFLEHGEPVRALELARADHELRPNAAAKTALAAAYLKAGRKEDAAKIVDEALQSPLRTAYLFSVAFEAYDAVGRTAEASLQKRNAMALNPHAFD